MARRGLRKRYARALAGVTLAGLLVLASDPAGAQGSADVTDPTAVVNRSRQAPAPARPSMAVAVVPVDVDAGLQRIRLYRPAGAEPEPLRAAVAADVSALLSFSGTAVYHPRLAVTVLDLGARICAGPGPSLTLRMVSLHHLPGQHLPLRFRGRELRLAVGMRIPLE
jgi:hypothetical protein